MLGTIAEYLPLPGLEHVQIERDCVRYVLAVVWRADLHHTPFPALCPLSSLRQFSWMSLMAIVASATWRMRVRIRSRPAVACVDVNCSSGRSLRAQRAFDLMRRLRKAEEGCGTVVGYSARMLGAAFGASAGSLQGFAGPAAGMRRQHRRLLRAMFAQEPWAQL